jgi:hypothetical protein
MASWACFMGGLDATRSLEQVPVKVSPRGPEPVPQVFPVHLTQTKGTRKQPPEPTKGNVIWYKRAAQGPTPFRGNHEAEEQQLQADSSRRHPSQGRSLTGNRQAQQKSPAALPHVSVTGNTDGPRGFLCTPDRLQVGAASGASVIVSRDSPATWR